MLSFNELYDIMANYRHNENFNSDDDSLLSYVQQDQQFWKRLATLANANPDRLAKALDVPVETVSTWYNKIQSTLHHAGAVNMEKKKMNMINTGT